MAFVVAVVVAADVAVDVAAAACSSSVHAGGSSCCWDDNQDRRAFELYGEWVEGRAHWPAAVQRWRQGGNH